LSKHGLVNDDIRKKVWPILLNLEILENKNAKALKEDFEWQSKNNIYKFIFLVLEYSKVEYRDYHQIDVDIKRSLNTFDVCKQWNKTIK